MIRSFVAIDLETGGLSAETDKITEVGIALFDIERKHLALQSGWFVNRVNETDSPDSRYNLSREVYEVTGIEKEWIRDYGMSEETTKARLNEIVTLPGVLAVVCHNVNFDRSFLAAMGWTTELPYVDTMTDLPANCGNKKLAYLALDRKVLSFHAHRSAYDAVQTGQILCTFSFDEVLARAQSPTVVLAYDVSYKERDKAKRLGAQWEYPTRHSDLRIPKTWCRTLKTLDLRDEQLRAGEAGLMTHVIDPTTIKTNGDHP